MKVSIVQNQIKWGFKKENLETFYNLICPLFGKSNLVVLPEMFSTGFAVNKPELAETLEGEAFYFVKRCAKDGNFALTGSIMALDGRNSVNRSFFCFPDGRIETADKRHLFVGDEKKYFTGGNKILNVKYMNVGIRVLVCYDLRFPVWSRYTPENPYEIVVYSANWPKDRIEVWDTLLRARAMENQAYVCASNAVGIDDYNISHNGHSCVLDTRGNSILSFEDNKIGVKTVEIDLNFQKKIRDKFPFLKDGDRFELL